MTELITTTGRSIECDSVVKGQNFNFLFIHTHALSRLEIDTIFEDPAETAVLTAVDVIEAINPETGNNDTATQERVYRGWTILDTVMRSPLYPGSLMIWLGKPEEE